MAGVALRGARPGTRGWAGQRRAPASRRRRRRTRRGWVLGVAPPAQLGGDGQGPEAHSAATALPHAELTGNPARSKEADGVL